MNKPFRDSIILYTQEIEIEKQACEECDEDVEIIKQRIEDDNQKLDCIKQEIEQQNQQIKYDEQNGIEIKPWEEK